MHELLASACPGAECVPYVWHYVTHHASDGLERLSTRKLSGASDGSLAGELAERALAATVRCARGLGATHAVLRTPPSFAPGRAAEERLTRFVERHRELAFVWEPQGLWEPERASMLAGSLGLGLLLPATSVTGRVLDCPAGSWRRVGELPDGRLRSATAEALEHAIGEDDVLVFEGRRALANLRTFVRATND